VISLPNRGQSILSLAMSQSLILDFSADFYLIDHYGNFEYVFNHTCVFWVLIKLMKLCVVDNWYRLGMLSASYFVYLQLRKMALICQLMQSIAVCHFYISIFAL